jgi:murein DD-endopeptidase MepM/ murein hydrolase activator NlpD
MPSYEPHVTPLVVPSLPSPQVFVTLGVPGTPSPLEPTLFAPLTLAPPTVQPAFTTLCTISPVGLYLRDAPSQNATGLELMPTRTELQWSGVEAQGGEYTWYEVQTAEGLHGWAASNWLYEGPCSEVPVTILAPVIIEQPCISGFNWSSTHFALDLHSGAGVSTIYAPYTGTVVASDTCPGCTADGNTDGQREDVTDDPDYNYGYGAMVVLEYPYADMSQEDREALQGRGISLGPGESLYLMIAHLDPQQAIAASGTALSVGDALATIGTSGNSSGPHAHVEVAVNASGLRPTGDDPIYSFWRRTVGERRTAEEQGRRIDPSPLFDTPSSCWGE